MLQPSTALIALSPSQNTQNFHQVLSNLRVFVKNKMATNTKEGILTELEFTKPTYQFIYSGLPGVIGLEEVITKAKQISPATKIILVVTDNDISKFINYMLINVDALIWVDSFFDSIETAIKQLSKGELFICGRSAYELRVQIQQKNVESKFDLGLLGLLTDREIEVLHSLTQGKNYKQIAQALFISESTVKTHINNIFTKLNVNDRTQAVLYALRHGIESAIKKPHVVQDFLNNPIQK